MRKQRNKSKFHPICIVIVLLLIILLLSGRTLSAQETIDPRSGRLLLTVTDLVLPAGAVKVDISRTFMQNQEGKTGLLGLHWKLNWEKSLFIAEPMVFLNGAAGTVSFKREGVKQEFISLSGEKVIFSNDGYAVRKRVDGIKEKYDPDGNLIEIDYQNGNRAVLLYDSNGFLTSVKGPKGNIIGVMTDKAGRITRIESSSGDILLYKYTEDELTEININGKSICKYLYDEAGNLITIERPQTGKVDITYDSEKRVLSRKWADGSEERYEYDEKDNVRRHIDAGGGVTTNRWSQNYQVQEVVDSVGSRSVIEYDVNGNPEKITGPEGGVVQITYDKLGRITSVTDPMGQTSRFSYRGNSSLTELVLRDEGTRIVFEYDSNDNLKFVKINARTVFAFTYTEEGMISGLSRFGSPEEKYTYYADGRLKSLSNALGESILFEYDNRGNLIRETNPLGGVTERNYDSLNRLISKTGPDGLSYLYTYDPKGLVAGITSPDGTTRYEYDALGQMTAEIYPSGQKISYKYDISGRLEEHVAYDNKKYKYRYDDAGNLIETTDRMDRTTRYENDALGRIVRAFLPNGLEISYEYDKGGRVVSIKDSTGGKKEFRYNAAGQIAEALDSAGAATTYQYDLLGRLSAETDPLGQSRRYTYTDNDLVESVTEPTGDEVRYEYDPAGRLVKVHRPGGGINSLAFNSLGKLISKTDPLGNIERNSYDPAGRLTAIVNARGTKTRFAYDSSGRISEEQVPGGRIIRYSYDRSGNLIEADDENNPVHFRYSRFGKLDRVEYTSLNKSVAYQHDSYGLRKKLILPDLQEILYEYDDLKNLSAIVLPDKGKIRFSYDEKDRLVSVSYPNKVTGTRKYDDEGRVIEIRYTGQHGKTFFEEFYSLDQLGNVVEKRRSGGSGTRYSYDSSGQLTGEIYKDASVAYKYSAGGNRIERKEGDKTTGYLYDEADRLIKSGEEKLYYDANGNIIERKGDKEVLYEFDVNNRLVNIKKGKDNITSYEYSAIGLRVKKEDSNGISYFIHDGLDLLQEFDEKLKPVATFIHMPGIDWPVAMMRDGRTYYYHTDRLGSVRNLTDEYGNIVATYNYDAFGAPRISGDSVKNPFAFTAREYDSDTGLYYFRARYYNPKLGRFISPDIIRPDMKEPLDLNPYLYVRNNPTRYIDPLGLAAWDLPGSFREMGSPQEWLQYWRLLKQRAIQQGTKPPIGTDNWIRNLKDLIIREGGGIPPEPKIGSSTRVLGERPGSGTVKPESGTKGTRALRTRPGSGTVSSSSGTPAGVPKGGGVSGKTVVGGVAGVIGAIGAAVNMQACLDEGNSRLYCAGELGLGIAAGTVIAAGAVALGAPAAGVAAVAGVVGVAGSVAAGNRWSNAPETLAGSQQQAAQEGQTDERFRNVLSNLNARVSELEKTGGDAIQVAQEANNVASNAVTTAKDAKRNISNLNSIESRINTELIQPCTKGQELLVKVRKGADLVDRWATSAKEGFEGAITILELCRSLSDVTDADALFRVSKTVARQAAKEYTEILSKDSELQQIIPKVKKGLKISGEAENENVRLLANIQAYKNFVERFKEKEQAAKDKYKGFEKTRTSLLKTVGNLFAAFPAKYHDELGSLKNRVVAVNPKNQPAVSTFLTTLQDVPSKVDFYLWEGRIKLLKSQASSCMNLETIPTEPDLLKAQHAIRELGDIGKWIDSFSEKKDLCLAKLKQDQPASGGQTPPQGSSGTTGIVTPPAQPPVQPPIQPPVTERELWRFGVSCSPAKIKIGGRSTCRATGEWSDNPGVYVSLTGVANWPNGSTVHGKRPGVVSVEASHKGASDSAQVEVYCPDDGTYIPVCDKNFKKGEGPDIDPNIGSGFQEESPGSEPHPKSGAAGGGAPVSTKGYGETPAGEESPGEVLPPPPVEEEPELCYDRHTNTFKPCSSAKPPVTPHPPWKPKTGHPPVKKSPPSVKTPTSPKSPPPSKTPSPP